MKYLLILLLTISCNDKPEYEELEIEKEIVISKTKKPTFGARIIVVGGFFKRCVGVIENREKKWSHEKYDSFTIRLEKEKCNGLDKTYMVVEENNIGVIE